MPTWLYIISQLHLLLKEVDNLILHFSLYFRLATLPFVKKNHVFFCCCFIPYAGYAEGKRRRAFKSLEKGKEIKGKIKLHVSFQYTQCTESLLCKFWSDCWYSMNSRGLLFFIPLVSLSYFLVTESLNCMVHRKVM